MRYPLYPSKVEATPKYPRCNILFKGEAMSEKKLSKLEDLVLLNGLIEGYEKIEVFEKKEFDKAVSEISDLKRDVERGDINHSEYMDYLRLMIY